MDRETVGEWLAGYERLWRTAGTAGLAELFTADASYRASPWRDPVVGLDALAPWWEGERDGPDEEFTASYEIVALDGPMAVVRVAVEYASTEGNGGAWRDLWVLPVRRRRPGRRVRGVAVRP